MKTKVLIISDTHGDETWKKLLKDKQYDLIVHAGDHLLQHQEMQSLVNYFVDGNNDWGNQNIQIFKIQNQNIVLVHGDEQHIVHPDNDMKKSKFDTLINKYRPNIIIYGHTHIPFVANYKETLLINPGSMSFSRHNGQKYYCELVINDNGVEDVNFFEY